MIDRKISHDDLVEKIKINGSQNRQLRQVASRMKDLLPVRFRQMQQDCRRSNQVSAADATRLCLVNEQYTSYLEQLTQAYYEALKSRVEYETHFMLYQARQSLRHFRRPPMRR